MKQQNSTILVQEALGKFVRTGKSKPKSSINENIDQYRRLVFNNVLDIIESTFPLAFKLVGTVRWTKLVKEYFALHACISPQFWQMPKEFFEYVKSNAIVLNEKFPQLINLLEMEWLETEVFMMPDESIPLFYIEGNLSEDKLIINPEIKIIPLNYPVYSKKANKITMADYSQYFISIHRRNSDKNVSINELGLIQVEILLSLNEKSSSVHELMHYIQSNSNYKLYTLEELIQFINFCFNQELILGYKK